MAESVRIDAASKRYPQRGRDADGRSVNELTVLEPIDLTIQPGEFVAILGPSGCGKSTLLRLIAGLDQPTGGEIRLGNGVVVRSDPRCAVVFQEPRLFPWKRVGANVAVGARRLADKPSTEQWLGRVGLTGFEHAYPHQLSGGMAQRAALARALIGRPQVLLLDEPFASLDALTRLQMQDLLSGVCAEAGTTAVMVTHDVDEALHLADTVVVLSQRPATIVETIRIDRPRPRQRGDAQLAPLRSRILRHFGFEEAHTTSFTPTYAPAGQLASAAAD